MRAQQSASPDDIDLISIGGAVKRALPKLMIGALIVGAGTFAALSTLPSKFTAQSQLEVGAASPAGDDRRPSDPGSRDKEAVATHVRAMQGDALSVKVTKAMKLAELPEFNSGLPRQDLFSRLVRLIGLEGKTTVESEEGRVLEAYKKSLKVFSARDTRQITVEFTSEDPRRSADVSNKVAELYRLSQSDRQGNDANEQMEKLKPQLKQAAEDYNQALNVENRLRGEIGEPGTDDKRGTISQQQFEDLNKELTKAKALRADAEARATGAREMMKAGTAEAHPDVQKSGLVPRLVEQRVRQQRQIAELSASLLPGHPRMKQLNADLGGLSTQIRGEVQKVVDSIEKEARVAKSREDNFSVQLEKLRKEYGGKAQDRTGLSIAENETKTKKLELERVQAEIEKLKKIAISPSTLGEVSLTSKALVPTERSWPKPGLIAPLAMVASLLFGLAWTVTRELLLGARGAAVPSAAAATKLAGSSMPVPSSRGNAPLPSLADVVADAGVTVKSTLAPQEAASAESSTISSMPALAQEVLDVTEGQAGFRSLITGEREGTDAGAAAIAFAKALAAAGRQVVLVDWSQNDAGIIPASPEAPAAGVSELLRGEVTFEDVIARLADSEAHAINAGHDHDMKLGLEPDRVNLVLDALDEAYDHIVVYAPHQVARDLFVAIQGRFDAGIAVHDARRGASANEGPNTFLGYQVADLMVLRYAPAPDGQAAAGLAPARMNVTRGRNQPEAHI